MTTQNFRITVGEYSADVAYDPADGGGWVATYSRGYGGEDERIVGDSQKVWHPDMPRRADARKKAERVARQVLRGLIDRTRF